MEGREGPATRVRRRISGPAGALLVGLLGSTVGAGAAAAQEEAPGEAAARADAALEACAEAAGEDREAPAVDLADRAEELYRKLESEHGMAVASLTGRAEVLVRCRIPLASFMRKGTLLEASNELLQRALRLDPESWQARFGLAMNHYHSPGFLGRTEAGIAEFERLVGQAERGAQIPVMAEVYLRLGDLYHRVGEEDRARRAWRIGAERFPERRESYESRLEELGTEGAPSADSAGVRVEERDRSLSSADSGLRTPVPMEPIVVETSSYSMEDPRSATELTKMDVYTAPGGMADVLQVFQTMPGVTRVTDGSDLYVRGGDPEETPMYVDGVRLFYPGRFETLNGSIFGVLEPSTLRSVYFSSGGFSARYGNALSGVVDIETEGRPTESRWRMGLNLASAGGTVWQPLGEKFGAWGTAMYTETAALLALHGRNDEFSHTPASFQGMLGLAFEPDRGIELRAVATTESDETTTEVDALGYSGPFTSRGRSRLAALTGRLVGLGGRAVLRASAGASSRRSGFELGVLDRRRTDRALGFRIDGDLDAGDGLRLGAGLEGARLAYEASGRQPLGEAIAPGSPYEVLGTRGERTGHLGGYVESEVRATSSLAVVGGVRADQLPGEAGLTVDPRLAVAWSREGWTLRVGGGLFQQGRWRVRYELPDAGSPSGVPTLARHLAMGVQRQGPVSARLEIYVKDYDGYVPDGEGPPAVGGRARGADLLVQLDQSRALTGWLSWSLLDADVDLDDGRRVPSAVDVTHTLTAVVKQAVGEAWELGLTGRYATGKPYTPILGRAATTAEGPGEPIYGGPHSARMPAYARLDARVSRILTHGDGAFVVYLEAINVLDTANVMAYTYDAGYRNRRPVESFFADRTLIAGLEARF